MYIILLIKSETNGGLGTLKAGGGGFCFKADLILRMRLLLGFFYFSATLQLLERGERKKERDSGIWEIVQTHTALTDYAAVNNRLPVLGH